MDKIIIDKKKTKLQNRSEIELERQARREEAEEVTVPAHKRKKKRCRAEILKDLPIEKVLHEVKAIPHKDSAADALSDFSSDCTEIPKVY